MTVAVQDRDRTASETAHDDGSDQPGGRDDCFDVLAPTGRRERVPIGLENRTVRCPAGRTRRPGPASRGRATRRTPIGSSNSASIEAVPDKSKMRSWVAPSSPVITRYATEPSSVDAYRTSLLRSTTSGRSSVSGHHWCASRACGRVDEELDLVAVGIVHVHPFGELVVQLEQDHDTGGFELALDGIELVE